MENPTKGSSGAEKCRFHTRLAQGTHLVGGITSLRSGKRGLGSRLKPNRCLETKLSVPPASEMNVSCTRDTKENIHWLRGWRLSAGFTSLRQESHWSLLLGGVLDTALQTGKGEISAWPKLPHTGAIFFETNTHLLDIKRNLRDQADTKSDACSSSRRLLAVPGAFGKAAGTLAMPVWTLHTWHGSALTHTLELPSINTYSPNSLSKAALPQPTKQSLWL